jgi:DNA helicase-2/ATP-dependent DNA helicase PcrA
MIDYERLLNEQQLEAVRHTGGPLLVIAGAGSGKTRTIVFRLARLVEDGMDPERILLLTFTRKASAEMLSRAETLLDASLRRAVGGTFHSFAFAQLRRLAAQGQGPAGLTVIDKADAEDIARMAKEELGLGKGDKSFPKKSTLQEIISKSRNKELDLPDLVGREAVHLLPYAEDMGKIAERYRKLKAANGLLDYDDLLFELEKALTQHEDFRRGLRERFGQIMVDEYQDTNKVQARLVRLLAGETGEVMAVGDDAQSIYAFRGADVANILGFPNIFPGAKVVRLERNYRSTQPILDVSNAILAEAREKFDKRLYTERTAGETPRLIRTMSDVSQAGRVLERIRELRQSYPLHEIAVLFRAGYQSYPLELALTKAGTPFRKYGGVRFHEAAHVKDVLAFLRLVRNPGDALAWRRAAAYIKGVGEKTCNKIALESLAGDEKALDKRKKKNPQLDELFTELDAIRGLKDFQSKLSRVIGFYQPIMVQLFPDDYPRRQAGLEELAQIGAAYKNLDEFLADLVLDPREDDAHPEDELVLTTVHSAKGLEFSAVILIDLVEERFPMKRALDRPDDMEEERRLMYVACTRAKDSLTLFAPECLWSRFKSMSEPARVSPFVRDVPYASLDVYWETIGGGLARESGRAPEIIPLTPPALDPDPGIEPGAQPAASPAIGRGSKDLGMCRHRIFGSGKIVAFLPPNKYQVNFPGFGLKVIIEDYLEMF